MCGSCKDSHALLLRSIMCTIIGAQLSLNAAVATERELLTVAEHHEMPVCLDLSGQFQMPLQNLWTSFMRWCWAGWLMAWMQRAYIHSSAPYTRLWACQAGLCPDEGWGNSDGEGRARAHLAFCKAPQDSRKQSHNRRPCTQLRTRRAASPPPPQALRLRRRSTTCTTGCSTTF